MNPRTPIIVHTVQEPMIPSRGQNMEQKKSRFGGRTLCIAISTLLFVAVGLILVFAFVRDPVSREAKETFQMLKECLNDTTISTNMRELVNVTTWTVLCLILERFGNSNAFLSARSPWVPFSLCGFAI